MFNIALESLTKVGFYEIINPFILLFVIVYAMLDKIKILKRNFNIAIAFAVAMLAISPEISGVGPNFVPYVNAVMPLFAFIICILFLALLVLALCGIELNMVLLRRIVWLIVIVDLIVPDVLILALISNKLNFRLPGWLSYLQTSSFMNLAVAVAAFFGIVYFITRD